MFQRSFKSRIQTIYSKEVNSYPGTPAQIKETAMRIIDVSKRTNIVTVITGHITKSGNIAGPKLLEHMVDVVIYFDNEDMSDNRILRVFKNRFGPTNEIGIFQMTSKGLIEVDDTASLFSKNKIDSPGNSTSLIMNGTRPLLIDVQALVTKSYYPNPRRSVTNFSINRVLMIIAVIEKFLKLPLYKYDIFVNAVGGIKIDDTSTDLSIAASILSSFYNKPIDKNSVFFGEVGLTGEIRKVPKIEKRVQEAKRLGYEKIYSPYKGNINSIYQLNMEIKK
jgi:DNA repair protein RadA/Sms